MSDQNIQTVTKILGEPISLDFSDNIRKIRNNLLITSLITIFVVEGGVNIDPSSTFFGMHFTGLTNQLIFIGLLSVNFYMLIHFIWCGFDCFLEWRVRRTGTRTAYITAATFADENADYPSDPRQSTMYNWWKSEARKIGSFKALADEVRSSLVEWQDKILTALNGKDPNINVGIGAVNQVGSAIDKMTAALINMEKTLTSVRIPISLERFDQTYKVLLNSQNLRWLILELGLPVIVGCLSVIVLTWKLI